MVLQALLSVVGIVFGSAVGVSVLGILVGRLFRWQWLAEQGPGISALVGLAGSILFLEIWNFFLPVSHASVAILAGFTLGGSIVYRQTFLETIGSWIKNYSALGAPILLLLLLTVSLFGLGPAESGHYDTGLYYLNTIRWIHEYPAIPGLANLHNRLGYNQSLFLFVALLSSFANMGLARACQIVNPIFVFISGWAVIDRLRLNLVTPKAKRIRLYSFLLLGPLFFLATQFYISAPTSDIAAAAFALPAALAFFCCLEALVEREAVTATNWLFLLTVCGCTIAKLKLSYAVLGGTAIGLAAITLVYIQPRAFVRVWIRIAVLSAFLFVPWMIRGVLLSGYAFFPSTLIRFHTDWAVPRKYADNEQRWIYSWARTPDKMPDEVLRNADWFGPWLERNAKDSENVLLFFFLFIGLVAWLFSFLTPMPRERRLLSVLLFVQTSLASFFWFTTAPDPRFGYATLLLFGVNGFNACADALARFSSIRSNIFAILITLVSVPLIFREQWPSISHAIKKFPQGFPTAHLEFKVTDSGLRVGIPKPEQAWNTGLVVTPYFNADLQLRGGNLKDGFRIRRIAPSSENLSD